MYDVLCAGMALIDSIIRGFNQKNNTAISGSLHVGGEAVNASIAAAKLGLKPGIVCALGDDAAGDLIRTVLAKYNVDMKIISSPQTPVTTMFVREDGNRKSIINEAHCFHPMKYEAADSKVTIIGSLFRAPFDDPEFIQDFLRKVKGTVIADTKLPREQSKAKRLQDIASSLPLIDYITPNEEEAKHLTGQKEPPKMADVFLEYGVKNVIIKLGADGCYFKSKREEYHIDGYKIKAIDATGAGDNFIAGFVSEFLKGKSISEILCFANACGAICTTEEGAGTALKSREQVLDWLEK